VLPLRWYAGLSVDSSIPLPQLPEIGELRVGELPTLSVRLSDVGDSPHAALEPLHAWRNDSGSLTLSLHRGNGRYVLRFPGLADFAVAPDSLSTVDIYPSPTTGAETLEHLLLDQVLPRLLAQRGHLVAHAGAVHLSEHMIAFMGETGHGKSTLTASFHLGGGTLASDDGLVLQNDGQTVAALPTYPSLRLLPDSLDQLFPQAPRTTPVADYSNKRRVEVALNQAVPRARPLTALYLIRSHDHHGISIAKASAREASIAILANSFQLDVTDRTRSAALFASATEISEILPVFTLRYPRDYQRLEEVRRAVTAHACSLK
jgi:hypothetical protein